MPDSHHPLLDLLLAPLSGLYRLLVHLRLFLYRRGLLKSHRVATPVVAVGNLSVGGSGKTPMVDYLLRLATERGLHAVSISRGYKGRSRGQLHRIKLAEGTPAMPGLIGDEPALLAWRNPGLSIYVGRDRYQAARLAETVEHPGLIILDDAYQHLRLARTLDILLIDATRGLDGGRLLPRGSLREPPSQAGRADLILITKSNQGGGEALMAELRESHGVKAPIYSCGYSPVRLTRLDGGAEVPLEALKGRECSLLCAIARPEGFVKAINELGGEVAELRTFRDHHHYSPADLADLEERLAGASSRLPDWITTEKDAVKLRERLRTPDRLWVLEMEVLPHPDAVAFLENFLSGLKRGD